MTGATSTTTLRRTFKVPRRHFWLALPVALLLAQPISALAVAVLSQGYQTDTPLAVGSIVSLDKNSAQVVQPSNIDNVDNLFGVVVGSGNALLALSNGHKNQVQVATSGVIDVIVSDVNGDINTGDQVTASPLDGVGMKATGNIKVIGIAQGDLKNSQGKSKQVFTDQNKQKHEAQLGVIPLLINPSYFFKAPEKTIIPTVIQNIANTLAGKKASPTPVIVALVIFVIAIISIIILVYAAIRSSIISVGRNPLSQAAVYRSLLQVGALILTILGASVGAIFLILTRL